MIGRRLLLKTAVAAAMLLALPLLGTFLAGLPLARYFEFPPQTRFVSHAPFRWAVFIGYAAFVLGVVGPFAKRWIQTRAAFAESGRRARSFPWWGWAGVGMGSGFWVLAWTRFSWFAPLQPHTFTPLWLCAILVVNALGWRHSGRCLLIDRPRFFLLLFPLSAGFWWFFEYLNRFVQNWYYQGVDFGPGEYFLYATLSFSTVLPAVLSTRNALMGCARWRRAFSGWRSVTVPWPRASAGAVLGVAGLGLAGIGVWPDFLFPLLWVAPLLIVVSLQALGREEHVFSPLRTGDWSTIAAAAFAALLCGWFWELWNAFSLAKWAYGVPFVQRFHIFEMPLLGYAGYLPFGLECAVIAGFLEGDVTAGSDSKLD